ncbi:MAG: trigger factor [Candidatus Zixiibacteriota bacterium]|nr:MAG: trigger factor [candidate division Zixibacteria bacterium]
MLKVTVITEPNCKRILKIEVPQEEVGTEFKNCFDLYRTKANISGFRPGKVPINLLKQRFGESIKADVFEKLVANALSNAIKQENLDPISKPKISEVDFDENKPLKFKAEFEVKPEIDLKGYKGLKLEKRVREVTDADVDNSLKLLQQKYAEFHSVNRKCHDDDMVIVDLIKKYDKLNKLKEEKLENIEIDLGSETVLKEFKEGLRGMGIGEMKEIQVKYPEDYLDKRLAGDEIKYLAIVKEVKEKELPELNDEFAKNIAHLKNLEELRKTVNEELIRKANNDATNTLRSDIIKKLIEKNSFEIPESMIERYLQSVTEDFKKRYKDVDEFQLRQNYRSIGEDIIRWQFIYSEIAKIEGIKTNEEDRAKWVRGYAKAYNMSEETARQTLGQARKFDEIDDTILENKVLDFITRNSEIIS